jgi:riboflavin kinase/FMN adenylyltransferase
MRVLDWNDFTATQPFSQPVAMTIGVFDGVHRGHQALIAKITESGLFPVVITFSTSPRKFFKAKRYINEITTPQEKLKIFEKMGLKAVVLIDFSEEFSKISGRDFIETLIAHGNVRYFAVGSDFRCGYQGEMGATAVQDLAEMRNIKTDIVPPVLENGLPVSSSRIRNAIADGDIKTASLLLGRPIGVS